jgi:hypothetical protein
MIPQDTAMNAIRAQNMRALLWSFVMELRRSVQFLSIACAVGLLAATYAHAQSESSSEALAKIAQNPVGNLISVPFQENANLNAGPFDHELNVLNIQPVIPIDITEDWNIITRTILPITSQPGFIPNHGRTDGLGDVQISAFLSPAKPGS